MLNASLTLGSDTYNRTSGDLTRSLYAKTGDASGVSHLLTIQQGVAVVNGRKNARRLVRLDKSVVSGDNSLHEAAVYLVIQHPQDAVIDETAVKDMVVALAGVLTASSAAVTVQIINGEL
jgi:hypothetical protein